MKHLLYILLAFSLIGCDDKEQQLDTNNINTDSVSKVEVNEITQNDYKIFPIDESGSDTTLVTFMNNLKKIVSNKDTAELFKVLDTMIIVSHGGGIDGVTDFSMRWKLDQPDKSELWEVLNRILNMGGTWENDDKEEYFCIPYTQSNKAFKKYHYDFDWYYTAVCISPKVIVYKEPKTTSAEVATLNYDVVEMNPEFMKSDFTEINTIDKKIQGYVKTGDLFYSADESLIIKKRNGYWKITEFAPYD